MPGTGRAEPGRARLDGLQAGRAIAALSVAVFHANGYVLPVKLYDGLEAAPAFRMGYAGVEYFFVLSGFIMALVHRADIGRADRAWPFMRRRIMRIYPIYWLVLAALVLTAIVVPGLGSPGSTVPWIVAGSALLLPMPVPPVLEISWTLTHEMLFYLVFMVLIASRTIGAALVAVWVICCVAFAFVATPVFPLNVLASPYNLLFLMGAAAALFFRHLPRPSLRPMLALGLGIFLVVGLSEAVLQVEWNFAVRTLGYGLGAMLTVAALAAGAVDVPRLLVLLGDASYAIYLVHMPAMMLATKLLVPAGIAGLPPMATLVLLIVVATLAGVAVHLIIEKPLLKWLQRPMAADAPPAATPG